MVRLTAALALIIPALISLTGAAPVPSVGSVVKRAAFELQECVSKILMLLLID